MPQGMLAQSLSRNLRQGAVDTFEHRAAATAQPYYKFPHWSELGLPLALLHNLHMHGRQLLDLVVFQMLKSCIESWQLLCLCFVDRPFPGIGTKTRQANTYSAQLLSSIIERSALAVG